MPRTPAASDPPLGLYRLLASFPLLASYRAKFTAVVLAATLLPAFLLVLALVLGAGRLGLVTLIALVVLLALVAAWLLLRAIDRLLVPLDLAEAAVDDVAFGRPVARTDLPGSDTAAQVMRGLQGLAKRVERDMAATRERGGRDELTGLLNRASGREQAQALIDRETRRGQRVRVLVADVVGFTAFNAAHGSGHGDAMLKVVASRLARLAGESGVAARWSGDAFVLVEAGSKDAMPDAEPLLGRPIVVKGSPEPLQLAFGLAESDERVTFDALVARAEADLAAARSRA